jgi:ribokinase
MDRRAGAVIVAGAINVDVIVRVGRLPGPGETVHGPSYLQQSGGKGANQAVAASRVGALVTLLGVVGGDDFGRSALAGMVAEGVDTSHCVVLPGDRTGLALIVVDGDGENQIAVAVGANGRADAALIASGLAELSAPAGAIVLCTLEYDDEAVIAAVEWASAEGHRVVLNPAPARRLPEAVLAARPILTPNATEAMQLTGLADAEAAARQLAVLSGAPVVVTLGAQGALLWNDGRARRYPASRVRSVDTTGAGDALNGILAAELSAGRPLEEALPVAMLGAAISTTRPGAQDGLPTREAVLSALAGEPARE